MKASVLLAMLASLSACSQGASRPAAEATASSAPDEPGTHDEVAGTYDYTLADGSDGTTVLVPDGTFTDAMDGETITGRWEVADGKLCLDPAGDGPDQRRACFTLSKPDVKGTRIATSDTGAAVKVVKRPA